MGKMSKFEGVNWLMVGLLVCLLGVMYSTSAEWLVVKDWNRQDYTYGWLIPVIVLYLIWEARNDFQRAPSVPSWWGGLLLLVGLAFYWLGELAGEFFTQYFSFSIIIIALCWMLFGWQKIKTILFALLFTLAMYPPPYFLHNKITLQLKVISSELGVKLLHLYGMSVYREGNIIDLGFTQLQVVDACSGLRYLLPLVILSLILAYFFKAALWKKAVLVFSIVPLTIIMNSVRIALTGILYEIWGPVVADDFFHGFSGWFIFMFSLGLLLVEMWVLSWFVSFRSIWHFPGDSVPEENDANVQSNGGPAVQSRSTLFSSQYIAALALLMVNVIVLHFVDFRDKAPIAPSFRSFPQEIGGWQGETFSLEPGIIETLDLTDYVLINFHNQGDKRNINFYSAYYRSQLKGESIHSPATCLPGSGWTFESSGTIRFPLQTNDKPVAVNRAFMKKGESTQLSYYWFPQRGRILTNAYQLKLYNFWDALIRQRTDGGLVRLITPVYPDETVESADYRLRQFTDQLMPLLDDYFPE